MKMKDVKLVMKKAGYLKEVYVLLIARKIPLNIYLKHSLKGTIIRQNIGELSNITLILNVYFTYKNLYVIVCHKSLHINDLWHTIFRCKNDRLIIKERITYN
jgi:hypothetical protein